MNCTCGGCLSCLMAQGYDPEQDLIEQHENELEERFISEQELSSLEASLEGLPETEID